MNIFKVVILGVIFNSLFFLVSCGQVNKESSPRNDDKLSRKVMPVIDSFFAGINKGEADKALKLLLSTNPNIDLDDSLTKNLEASFNSINATSGRFMAYKLVRKKQLNDDIGVYSFLVKYERKFYRFVFTFYNNDININIYKFSFDDNIDTELEAALRLFMN